MNMQQLPLGFCERAIFALRSLYNRHGYTQYKMSKFEEYDLYARNKDFLISDSVITFTDVGGKLMALKPDVTLSIVKNTKDVPGAVQKLYYNENVYRVAKGSYSFKEIMQVGLECLGDIDDYCVCEVLQLAAESLRSVSEDGILDISHLGLLSDLTDAIGIPAGSKADVLRCIGEKNQHELTALCSSLGVSDEHIGVLCRLVSMTGAPGKVLPEIQKLLSGITDSSALDQLIRITKVLEGTEIGQMLRIDFSVVDDIHYYNGIVFKGFIAGIPESVLSGGQYDKLMRKLQRKAGAIGFAVYTDLLERLEQTSQQYDVDAVLLYEAGESLTAIQEQVRLWTQKGSSILAQPQKPENIRYRQLLRLKDGEVEIVEDNA